MTLENERVSHLGINLSRLLWLNQPLRQHRCRTEQKIRIISTHLSVSGGLAPYTWSNSDAPSRMSLSAYGVLSGKPTTSGTYTFNFQVKNSLGNTATQSLSIKVN
jgi:hypothetical protein